MMKRPTIDTIRTMMMSPRSAVITLNAFEKASISPVSSMTIIMKVRVTTGMRIMVIESSAPIIDAIRNGANRLMT